MHIHILGICGTFMSGIALIARSLGHKVTGSDQNIYPPMSTLLANEKIDMIQGYDPAQLASSPDLVIIGNALSRGNPCVEYVLNKGMPYTSAPRWLYDEVLQKKWVIAVAGTHGKTTTAGMVNWILEKCGYNPGFAIGGIPGNFNIPAKLTDSPFFVIEADEYDSAFFDKRSKFMHYCPRTVILNNLEFDHADIFDNLGDIQRQFEHLLRLVPEQGRIIVPKRDKNLRQVIAKGCWSELCYTEASTGWKARRIKTDSSQFKVYFNNKSVGEVKYHLMGEHNMHNALMAIAAVYHVGVRPQDACLALSSFINAKRRLEHYANINGIEIYNDFAHHPTAIFATLEALRSKVGADHRILAVLEPRSNTMKLGLDKSKIPVALGHADEVYMLQPDHLSWTVSEALDCCIQPAYWAREVDTLVDMIVQSAKSKDVILIMSNGYFDNIHSKILTKLKKKFFDKF